MLTWTPRILAILYIGFISIFAFDVFDQGYFLWETILALFMHLIPSYILIGATVLAWKRPKLGGIGFLLLSIVFTLFFKTYQAVVNFTLVSVPLLIIGALFLADASLRSRFTR
ncbi:hypothetical protein HYZ99_05315 [Candidatus Peregrinibacteria bacterium]|nr:hypothetical protein [Candidatus Peregrinibacteria bacterium]